MKTILLTSAIIIACVNCLFAQTESKYFEYKTIEEGYTIRPKGKVNTVLAKPFGRIELDSKKIVDKLRDLEAKPFQRLIDNGAFTKARMKELEKEEGIMINTYIDDTGITLYVYFYVHNSRKSILTDNELYCIVQEYMKEKIDFTGVKVYDEKGNLIKSFHSEGAFRIPFKELKY